MLHCITAIWHSRVIVIPAEYHTSCVSLQRVRVYVIGLVASKVICSTFSCSFSNIINLRQCVETLALVEDKHCFFITKLKQILKD